MKRKKFSDWLKNLQIRFTKRLTKRLTKAAKRVTISYPDFYGGKK